jgi:hypothetical protein
VNFITGLGGRDVSIQDAIRMYEITQEAARKDRLDGFVIWVGVRE